MSVEGGFDAILEADTRFGFLSRAVEAARRHHPQLVINRDSNTMLRAIRDELRHSESFVFSVAFVSPRAVALLKQDLVEFAGRGLIVTSDYLGFNSPRAFAELLALKRLGIDVRLHTAAAYHPKGYLFGHGDRVTAVLGSSNLTESALVSNYEWNLKVTASVGSDLARQFQEIVDDQYSESIVLEPSWVEAYASAYVPPTSQSPRPIRVDLAPTIDAHWPLASSPVIEDFHRHRRPMHPPRDVDAALSREGDPDPSVPTLEPNAMQREALASIAALRAQGERRAMVISATGTGKTILSALDVRAFNPERMLYVVHREQILDRAISEYQRVLAAPASDFGKLTGGSKEEGRKYVFATIQTLSRPDLLESLAADAFDYILIDEVHRAGAASYRRVIDHFTPKFLLGMTATPERSDDFDLFELFDYNVAYEIRLGKALESGMLSPFHYYGITDVVLDNGEVLGADADLSTLVSRARISHIVNALDTYGQAGVKPRGLIFCSRVEEARALSAALNQVEFRGANLQTVALSGSDSPEARERAVEALERGELDYILTVDVFNEGVDIPSVNQVVMLRQTQSAIIFVQQLGRGLRLNPGKEYVVVIDFIGNYANNYMIPIALFGDDSLNRESLRKNLAAAEESGVLPGLSSVRFDRIARERVLRAIAESSLDSIANLKRAVELLRARLGRLPELQDFIRFESADPVVVATRAGNYPALLEKVAKISTGLTEAESRAMTMLSLEVLDAKRLHETLVLKTLVERGSARVDELGDVFSAEGIPASAQHVQSAVRSLGLDFYTKQERRRYGAPIAEMSGDGVVRLAGAFAASLRSNPRFRKAVDDLVVTALKYIPEHYIADRPFTPGRQYSRKDACRLLNWDSNVASTIYGYKVDRGTGTCPIFVTYHKADHVSASTAYEDELLDRHTMLWYTRSRRTLASAEVDDIVSGRARPYVFAQKDDAEGTDFYFLGEADPSDAEETTMRNDRGELLKVVRMLLHLEEPIDTAVYDYFHPVVTN